MNNGWGQTITLMLFVAAVIGGILVWADAKHERFATEHIAIYQVFADIEAEARVARARITCGGISRAQFLDWVILLTAASDHGVPTLPTPAGVDCGFR